MRNKTRVLITGSNGRIGSILSASLLGYDLTLLDLPDFDAKSYQQSLNATSGQDVVIHLAWNPQLNYTDSHTDIDCFTMSANIYKACAENGVKRIIMASSVHAYPFIDHHIKKPDQQMGTDIAEKPSTPYMVSKQKIEQHGMRYAQKGVDVICIRYGAVYSEDLRYEDIKDRFNRIILLRHNDLINLISRCIESPLINRNYLVINAVSDIPGRIHKTGNIIGWRPIPRQFQPRKPPVWFDSNHLLLLKTILANDTESIISWKEWCNRVNFDDIDHSSYQAIPAISARLVRLGVKDPLLPKIKGIHRRTWFANQFMLSAVIKFLDSLDLENIDYMIIKGGSMLSNYADIGLRPMHDIDVLVQPSNVNRVIDLLDKMGWMPYPRVSLGQLKAREVKTNHSWGFGKNGTTIDLHWHILHADLAENSNMGLWKSRESVILQGKAVRIPDTTYRLFITCLHGVRWEPNAKLTWVIDTFILFEQEEKRIDWNLLLKLCIDRQLVLPMRVCLRWLKTELDAPIPDDILIRFDAQKISMGQLIEFKAISEEPRNRTGFMSFVVSHYRNNRGQNNHISGLLTGIKKDFLQFSQPFLSRLVNYNWQFLEQFGARFPRLFLKPVDQHDNVEPINFDHWYLCNQHDEGTGFLHHGWAPSEADFTWSYQAQATISYRTNTTVRQALIIKLSHYNHHRVKTKWVDVWCDHTPIKRLRFDTNHHGPCTLFIGLPDPDPVSETSIRNVTFVIHHPERPTKIERTNDNRLLGICLHAFQVATVQSLNNNTIKYKFYKNNIETCFAITGWAEPEQLGTWSIDKTSTLRLPLNIADNKKVLMEFELTPFIPKNKPEQVVSIFVNHHPVYCKKLIEHRKLTTMVEYMNVVTTDAPFLNITIKVSNPGKPSENENSNDSRYLGIMLHSLSFSLA